MTTVLTRKLKKDLTETEGYVLVASSRNYKAGDVELKSVHAMEFTPQVLHRIAGCTIASPGLMDNYFRPLITNTATAGPSVEAVGSHDLYFRSIGE